MLRQLRKGGFCLAHCVGGPELQDSPYLLAFTDACSQAHAHPQAVEDDVLCLHLPMTAQCHFPLDAHAESAIL